MLFNLLTDKFEGWRKISMITSELLFAGQSVWVAVGWPDCAASLNTEWPECGNFKYYVMKMRWLFYSSSPVTHSPPRVKHTLAQDDVSLAEGQRCKNTNSRVLSAAAGVIYFNLALKPQSTSPVLGARPLDCQLQQYLVFNSFQLSTHCCSNDSYNDAFSSHVIGRWLSCI